MLIERKGAFNQNASTGEMGGLSVPLKLSLKILLGMKVLKGTMGVIPVIKDQVRVVADPSNWRLIYFCDLPYSIVTVKFSTKLQPACKNLSPWSEIQPAPCSCQ